MKKNKKKKLTKSESLELTKTLVLNFNEVEKVAKYEKKTSKKPAIVIAIFGMFAILSGLLYPNIYNLVNNKSKNVIQNKKFRKIKKNTNNLTCTKTDTSIENNTTSETIIKFNFDNSGLISYESIYNELSTSNSLTQTPNSITALYNYIEPLTKITIDGYTLTHSYKTDQTNPNIVNSYTVKLNVDLKRFNKEKLTDQHKANAFLNVSYNYKENLNVVKNNLESNNYKCNKD